MQLATCPNTPASARYPPPSKTCSRAACFGAELADTIINRDPDVEHINRLSPQQLQILILIAQGEHTKAIVDQVHLSPKKPSNTTAHEL